MELTKNEQIALNMIALNDYQQANGSRPESFDECTPVWSHCLDCTSANETISGRTLSATCASLAKKGLVIARNYKRRPGSMPEDTIELTEAGYNAWLTAFPS